MGSAESMKDKLGHAMCLAKWKQVSLHLTTGMTNSCYHPPLHPIDPTVIARNPSALHNTEHKKDARVQMLKQERPSECSYCWNIEDSGNLSDRHYRSGEPWAAESYDQIMNSTGREDAIPSYVEVNFNSACNLKCSYCSPQFSSKWAEEVDRFGAYPTSVPHNDPTYFTGRNKPIPNREENPYVEAFWKWWPELYPHLKHFRMTGGEPLMDKNTYKVFDYVLAMPKHDLHLNVTSNFSVEDSLFQKYLQYVKDLCNAGIEHFMQYVSVDTGNPDHAEYLRHGMDYYIVLHRAHMYLSEIPYRNSLTFIITLNNLSVVGIRRLLERILQLRKDHSSTYQRVWFDTPLLRTPVWQSLQILPRSYSYDLQQTVEWMKQFQIDETSDNKFHGFKDFEIQRLQRAVDWMKLGHSMNPETLSTRRADFYRFFSEHDKRRNTSFENTFPEMQTFWDQCKYLARNTNATQK